MRRALRIDTLQWIIGIYILIRGASMLMVPHQLSTQPFVPIQPYLPWLGALQVLGGTALIMAATLLPRRSVLVVAHLVGGAALLQAATGHFLAGFWSSFASFGIMGVGVAIAPFLPKIQARHPHRGSIDLFGVILGIRMAVEGAIFLLSFSDQFSSSIYDPIRSALPIYGGAYLFSGLALCLANLYPNPSHILYRLVHLIPAGVLWAWTAGLGFPTWNSILYYGGLGTAIALLPWLNQRLRQFDPDSLQAQLAVTLVGIVTLPLLIGATLVALPQERAAVLRAQAVQQTLAVTLSENIDTYINLHLAAIASLASQPSLAALPLSEQTTVLRTFKQSFPDVVVVGTYDANGNAIARSDENPPGPSAAELSLWEVLRRTNEPVIDIRVGRIIKQPLFMMFAPMFSSNQEFVGATAGAIAATRVTQQLAQTATDTNVKAYLVDDRGRIIAHPETTLVQSFTDYSTLPPVAALLASGQPESGGMRYWDESEWQIAGYARIPNLGWGVVVERPARDVLASINEWRNRDFSILLIMIATVLVIGTLIARKLTDPLTTLTHAAGQLAAGDTSAPLPQSSITEVVHLSTVFGAMRDRLTQRTLERDRAEAELRQSEAKIRRLIESNVIGVIVVEINGPVVEANDAFLDMVGYSREDLRHSRIRWRDMFPPEYIDTVWSCSEELRLRGVCAPFETEYFHKQGHRVPLLLGFARLEGTPNRMIGFVLDLTERKQIEAERMQLLERERAARETAESANRVKDEFLAVLSHELRSPLNPILGWAKLLRSRPFDQPTIDRALEIIERNAKLQTQLIEDLLDVSRILRGKMTLNVTSVDVATVIEAAIETVRLAADAKGIHLAFKVCLDSETTEPQRSGSGSSDSTLKTTGKDAKLQVAGDPGRLQQVVWNLLTNAVKFTPSGGRVDVTLKQIDTYAQIQVADTGQGISPDFLPYVFDYFRQSDSTTTRKFGGLGLGLALVRHFTELHGGSVQVESPGTGLGATFTVTLPLMMTGSAPASDGDRPSTDEMNLDGLAVLVVDDEPDIRELVAFILKQYGATVTVATSARDALTQLDRSHFDLLVCDIGMPDVDGYTLMQKIRSRPAAQSGTIPAIALTAYAGEVNQKKSIAAGFQLHVAKPVEPVELVRAIASIIQPKVQNVI